jgi:hypothetical protein
MAKPPFPFFRFSSSMLKTMFRGSANWVVIPGLGPGIHAFGAVPQAWILAPSAGMTIGYRSNTGAQR